MSEVKKEKKIIIHNGKEIEVERFEGDTIWVKVEDK